MRKSKIKYIDISGDKNKNKSRNLILSLYIAIFISIYIFLYNYNNISMYDSFQSMEVENEESLSRPEITSISRLKAQSTNSIEGLTGSD